MRKPLTLLARLNWSGGLRLSDWVAIFFSLLFSVIPLSLHGETGAEGWLRYAALDQAAAKRYERLPGSVVVLNRSLVLDSAQLELSRGVRSMLGWSLRSSGSPISKAAIVLGTLPELHALAPTLTIPSSIQRGRLLAEPRGGGRIFMRAGGRDYGTRSFVRSLRPAQQDCADRGCPCAR